MARHFWQNGFSLKHFDVISDPHSKTSVTRMRRERQPEADHYTRAFGHLGYRVIHPSDPPSSRGSATSRSGATAPVAARATS
jgi:hypothetical protein